MKYTVERRLFSGRLKDCGPEVRALVGDGKPLRKATEADLSAACDAAGMTVCHEKGQCRCDHWGAIVRAAVAWFDNGCNERFASLLRNALRVCPAELPGGRDDG